MTDRSRIGQQILEHTAGIAVSNSEAVFHERCNMFYRQWAHVDGLVEYVQNRITPGPVIKDHVLEPEWYEGTPLMWTKNNAESLNNIINSTQWKVKQLPDLINILYSPKAPQKG